MQFANSHLLPLILAIPLIYLAIRYFVVNNHRKLSEFADENLLEEIVDNYHKQKRSSLRRPFWTVLLCLLLLLGIFRPQMGFTWKESRKLGVDIVVAVDVSESMLANDLKPNRLTHARRELLDLLAQVKGDRLGLVAFAGVAFTETPLTLDYGAFRNFISSLSPGLIPIRGTNIEAAINESIATLQKGDRNEKKIAGRSKAIILITDGEHFEGELSSIKQKISALDIGLYIIGIGTQEGAPIITPKGHKRDKNGNIIISKLQPAALQQLAIDTGGLYVNSISSDQDTIAIYDLGIRKQLKQGELAGGKTKRWNEQFQIPLLFALALILLGPWGQLLSIASQIKLSNNQRNTTSCFLLITLSIYSMFLMAPQKANAEWEIQSVESIGKEALEDFSAGKFDESLEKFQKAAQENDSDYRIKSGLGANYYRLGKFQQAKQEFSQAAELANQKNNKARALFNAANSMVQLGDYQGAIAAYEKSLSYNVDDKETSENLAYAKRLLEQEQKENKKQSKDKDKDKDNKEQTENKRKDNNQQQEEDNQKKEQEDREKQADEQKKSEEEEEEEEKKREKEQQEKQEEKPEQTGEKKTPRELNKADMQLDAIEEKRVARFNYRFKKAMKQLEEENRVVPEKDW